MLQWSNGNDSYCFQPVDAAWWFRLMEQTGPVARVTRLIGDCLNPESVGLVWGTERSLNVLHITRVRVMTTTIELLIVSVPGIVIHIHGRNSEEFGPQMSSNGNVLSDEHMSTHRRTIKSEGKLEMR